MRRLVKLYDAQLKGRPKKEALKGVTMLTTRARYGRHFVNGVSRARPWIHTTRTVRATRVGKDTVILHHDGAAYMPMSISALAEFVKEIKKQPIETEVRFVGCGR